MKAIKHFIVLLSISTFVFTSCKDRTQNVQKLDESTRAYFEVKNDSKYVFTELSDTNISITYTSKNYINNTANQDIENNEIMSYEMEANGFPVLTFRSESGGLQFKDRIAMLTKINDSMVIGPVMFNLGGVFSAGFNSGDSITQYATYNLNGYVYNDVVRVKPYSNLLYKEVFFAKNIGLIGRKEKNGKFYYLKRYTINK